MTIEQPTTSPDVAVQHRWLVRWTGAVNSWNGRFDAAVLAGRRQGQIALSVSLEPLHTDRVLLESWIDLPAGRESVVDRCLLPARLRCDDHMLHIDCQLTADEPLAVTLDHVNDQLLYVRTTLTRRAGLPVGSLDPPTLVRAAAGLQAVASTAPLKAS